MEGSRTFVTGARARGTLSLLVVTLAILGVTLAMVAMGCGGRRETPPAKPLIGLVFDVGGLGDKSFNDSAYRGLVWARDSLGVEIRAQDPGEGSQRESALRFLAGSEARLVYGVGFLFTDDIRRVAEEFPQKHFACIDYSLGQSDTLPPNLLAVRFREEEGAFLVGALAALKSRSGTIGFVGGMDIPLIHRFQAGYEAGARHANPGVKVLVGYAGVTGDAFKDPAKGKELARSQYAAGADIIFHASGATGLGVFEAARRENRLAIGVDSDQHDEAPGFVLTSMVKRVDEAVYRTIRAEIEGTFAGGVVELGLAEKGVDYVYDQRNEALLPEEIRARVEEYRRQIIAGEIEVPTRPAS